MTAVPYEKHDRIAYVTINRPEAMNAINAEVRRGLAAAFDDFRRDPETWVAIVTGTGDKAFSAGADLKEMSQRSQSAGGGQGFWTPVPPALGRGMEVWKPIIAAVNGYCLAGGLELALACDIRIAAEHATFALTEVMRGILPAGGGTQRLPRTVPFGIALEMLFTGDRIDAREAWRIGLVNRVVPAAELMPSTEALARRICQNAPLSVRAVKELAYRGRNLSLEEGLREELMIDRIIRTTEDSGEGPRAFAEKRDPQWKGR
jgi:E-phenylitaconyl-CoA hydratase